MSHLAVIVVDSAERAVVEKLVAAGELPAIARLIERGAFCPLRGEVAYRAEYANTELLTLLATTLSVSKSALELVIGQSSKHKVVAVAGLSADEVTQRLLRAVAER